MLPTDVGVSVETERPIERLLKEMGHRLRVLWTPIAAVGEGGAPRSWHVWKMELMGCTDGLDGGGERGRSRGCRQGFWALALDSMECFVLGGDVEGTLKSDLEHSQAGLPTFEAS